MTHPSRLGRIAGATRILAALLLGATAATAPVTASAQGLFAQPKYAAIVEDANTGEVLYSMRAEALRHPASLTKIMTLYLTFEALSTGRLRMGEVITISPHAFSMMPSKVSTHPGETLTVAEAIPTMTVHSANDVAVAMAERISGSEPAFARLMTLRARELGMTETSFVNASGLPPDGDQISSARDMAILARAVMRDYPQYYAYFGLKSIDFHGKLLMNHNHLVAKMPGVDGMKTGYTSLAGFNLVASGVRDGHRLITVVLGGPSVAARDENVEELLDAGFTVLRDRSMGQRIRLASLIASPDDMGGPIERAPIEEGSADQANLQVEVQPQLRTLPTMNAAEGLLRPAPPAPSPPLPAVAEAAPASEPCTPPRGRRHRRRVVACATAVAKAEARPSVSERTTATETAKAEAAPCAKPRRHHRHAACETETAGATSPKRAAASTAAVETANAEAAACPKPSRHHRHAACATETAAASALKPVTASKASAEGGGYMIQVGAYKSRGLAQGQVAKLASVVAGAGKVEEAGGNYRARFRGLSQQQAKAACHSLSAKGQACMVMAGG